MVLKWVTVESTLFKTERLTDKLVISGVDDTLLLQLQDLYRTQIKSQVEEPAPCPRKFTYRSPVPGLEMP